MIRRLLLAVLLLLATDAIAQPTGWSAQRVLVTQPSPSPFRFWVRVLDLGTGEPIATFEAPSGVTLGSGALTPDGRFYLAATNLGVARFTTTPPSFDRLLSTPGPVTGLWVAPAGTTMYASGAFGRVVIDWESGSTISAGCCAPAHLVFTPDGARRVEFVETGRFPFSQTVVAAYDTATGAELWSRSFPGPVGRGVAINAVRTALSTGGEVFVLDVLSGVETGRIPMSLGSLHWRGDALVGHRTIPGLPTVARIAKYQPPSWSETTIAEMEVGGGVESLGFTLSADGRHAYWLRFLSVFGISVSSTSYSVIDLDTSLTVASGSLGPQMQSALALEATAQCILAVPEGLTAPVQGGIVDVPVEPTPNCRPWSTPGAMNPGPHTGPVTIREPITPNAEAQPQVAIPRIGGTVVRIVQDAAPPAAPMLRGTVDGDRVRLSWEPGIGAGITGFEIRGGLAGGSLATVLTTEASARDWTTPALGPGSYVVQVAARNFAGTGPASNEFRFSTGVLTPPDAPIALQATVMDDQVTLTWSPPVSGPAPSGYVVEAAPGGATSFAAVARTSDPYRRVTRAPAGNWQVRVRAATAGGVGVPSAAVTVTPSACTSPPSAPQTPWTLATFPSFTLQWAVPATGSVEQYVVDVGSALGASDVGTVAVSGDRTSVVVPYGSGMNRGFARIRARNGCGDSPPTPDIVVQLP